MSKRLVWVVFYPYDSEGIIAVYSKKEPAMFLVKTLNGKRSESKGNAECKEMEVQK